MSGVYGVFVIVGLMALAIVINPMLSARTDQMTAKISIVSGHDLIILHEVALRVPLVSPGLVRRHGYCVFFPQS